MSFHRSSIEIQHIRYFVERHGVEMAQGKNGTLTRREFQRAPALSEQDLLRRDLALGVGLRVNLGLENELLFSCARPPSPKLSRPSIVRDLSTYLRQSG